MYDTVAKQRPLPEETLILDGRFRLKKLLGEGGMGLVYLGEQVSLGRPCAVKVLREDLSLQHGMGERFRREALLLSSVDHGSVVRVIDFGVHGASACLVMEYADGQTLEAALRTEAFPPERCLRLLMQLAQGLAAIHEKGIVHRDLKPENVMLTRAPGGELARLLDFGIARLAQPDAGAPGTGNVTQVGLVLGTPEYLSPEQALGQPLDARSDIYAFGILAFRMLSGQLPFDGPDLQQYVMQHAAKAPKQLLDVAPHLFPHSALATLVMSCLEKRPEARPQTAVALAGELARFSVTMPDATAPLLLTAAATTGGIKPIDPAWAAGSLTSPSQVPAAVQSPVALPRRSPWKLWAGAGAFVLVAAAVVGALLWYSPARRARRLIAVGRGSEALQIIDDAKPAAPATDFSLSQLESAALHQVGRHDDELELMKVIAAGVALEPQAIEALADDFGRRDGRTEAAPVRKVLIDFPKTQVLPVLQTLAVGPAEGSSEASDASLRASTAWAQWGSLRFIDLEYAGQGLPLVELYVRNLFVSDCRVRAIAAGRLAELRSPAAVEALKRLKDAPRKNDNDCGHAAAAQAVKVLEKDSGAVGGELPLPPRGEGRGEGRAPNDGAVMAVLLRATGRLRSEWRAVKRRRPSPWPSPLWGEGTRVSCAAMRLHRLLLLCCACSPVQTEEPESTRQPIWGGVPAPNDHAVFRINNGMAACTASLIAPRTLLTANHCAFSGTIVAENLPSSSDVFTVTETQRFTDAFPDAGQVDLSLMQLDRAPPVAPLSWDWTLRMPPVGTKVRHIGYGGTDDGSTGRRTVTVETGITLFDPTSGVLVLSGNRDAGACYGDSGGPLMLVGADGGDERVLGVVARLAAPECGPVASVLLPHYRVFVEQWLTTHEDAGCPRDGRCVMGCAPVDHDCDCGADGQCTTACADLDDPDCPADCRSNQRCSAQACPRPDTDCTPPGDWCFTPLQCAGRQCISDPQHSEAYCTGSCDAGCASGFQCDAPRDACIKAQRPEASLGEPCTDGVTLCRNASACLEGSCRTPCSDDAQCADAGELCREPMPRYCAPTVTGPALDFEHASAKGGCSVAGAIPLAVLALLTATRRAAARRSTASRTASASRRC